MYDSPREPVIGRIVIGDPALLRPLSSYYGGERYGRPDLDVYRSRFEPLARTLGPWGH